MIFIDKLNKYFIVLILILWGILASATAAAEPAKAKLVQSVMCEAIENFKPVSPSVVFSISQGEVFCYSSFDPVYEKTHIFHKWYKMDKLIFTMKLTLTPPKWASFSRVQIREADKGPWRVEIRDADNTLLKTLRFSMAD